MKNKSFFILHFSFIILMLAACKRVPPMVLERDDMAALLVDLELANAVGVEHGFGDLRSDSARLALRQAVLAKHGVNEAVMDSSMRWYGAHLGEYLKVLDQADSLLADTLSYIDTEIRLAKERAAGDTLDLWTLEPSIIFARNQPSNIIAFEVPADSTWRRGDVVTLSLTLDNARTPLSVTLGADYANRGHAVDVKHNRPLDDQRRITVQLQLDSNINVSRIYGYMQMHPAEGERAFADSIRLTRTRLVSDHYNERRSFTQRLRHNDL